MYPVLVTPITPKPAKQARSQDFPRGGGGLIRGKVDRKPKGGGGLIWGKCGPLYYYTLWSLWHKGGGSSNPPPPPRAKGL